VVVPTDTGEMRVPALDPLSTEPRAGDLVDLVLSGGWRLPVRLTSDRAADGDVELVPVAGSPAMPADVESLEATLEWRSPRGLVRRHGTLSVGGSGFRLQAAREAVVMQRRNFARVRCSVRVAVEGDGVEGELLTRTVDLSVGGMLIEHAARLEVDERVRFTLSLDDDTVVRGEGTVVRATPFGHRAIQFDEFPRRDEQIVARFVFAQEREGRSAAAYA
jgi:hypothetical protein